MGFWNWLFGGRTEEEGRQATLQPPQESRETRSASIGESEAAPTEEVIRDDEQRRERDRSGTRRTGQRGTREPETITAESTTRTGAVSQTIQHLYLDFQRSADDLVDMLERLRGRHGRHFFPGVPSDRLLQTFLERFFPEDFPGEYLICNISYKETPYFLIRPAQVTPRMLEVLPRGLTLAIKGHLWDNLRFPHSPAVWVRQIVDLADSPPRPFERTIRVRCYHSPENVYPASNRRSCCLSPAFIQQLPRIHDETGRRLEEWRAYVEFRRRMAAAGSAGLRYVSVEVTDGRYARFLVVSKDRDEFYRLRSRLRRDELTAYPLSYSAHSWTLRVREDSRVQGVQLGYLSKKRAAETPAPRLPGCPWESPFAAWVEVELSEELQDEYEDALSSGDEEAARERVRQQLPPEGFLAIPIVGDVVLARRFDWALRTLQEQGGYAPFLSTYLFDISTARVPQALEEIPDEAWGIRELNDAQKRAVQVMLSAPDIALIQGPPGTGKTTVIAEAAYQFARRGMRVLIASQANLAVDNALERLPLLPEVRAVRLGPKGQQDLIYSEENALGTFYRAVAARCRENTLTVWESLERQVQTIERWLEEARLLEANVTDARQRLTSALERRDSVAADLERARREHEAAERQAEEAEEIRKCAEAIEKSCSDFVPREMPQDVAEEVLKSFVRPFLETLREAKIRVPAFVQERPRPDIAAALLRETLERWAELSAVRGDIENALAGLEDGVGALDPQTQLEWERLRRKRDELLQRLPEDPNVVTELQDVQRKMVELEEKRSAGLSPETIEVLFGDRTIAVGDAEKQRELLQAVRTAISEAEKLIRRERSRLVPWLRQQAARRTPPDCDIAGRVDELAAGLTGAEQDVRDARAALEAAERRLQQHLGGARESFPQLNLPDDLERARTLLEQRLEHIRQELSRTEQLRHTWRPLLKWWCTALEDTDRARTDAQFYMPEYIAACNVVGVSCTENPRTLDDAGHAFFDVVIVDEVSKATPPELLIPLLKGKKAILVGDHRQLPPLFRESAMSWEEVVAELEASQQQGDDDGDNANEGLADADRPEITPADFARFKSMVTSSLFKELFEQAPSMLKATLTVQFRMHPEIMKVVNHFYDHMLECGLEDPDAERPDSDPRSHRLHGLCLSGPGGQPYVTEVNHVVWIDSSTDPRGKPAYEETRGTSKVNVLEARIIANILCDMELAFREQGYGPERKKRVGVVSFYGAQIREIRNAIREVQQQRNISFRALRADINTVDRYQGQERPIILVSLVRSPRKGLSSRALTAQFQRINVAMSRAQELLIVVGARKTFERYPIDLPYVERPGSRKAYVYRDIIKYIESLGGLKTAADVIR